MDRKWIYTSIYYPKSLSKFLRIYSAKIKPLKECDFKEKFHIFTIFDYQDKISQIQIDFQNFIIASNLEVSVSSRWSWGFFVVAKNVDKMATLEILAKISNTKISEIIAFGDSRNDVEMLKNVGYGVAVANALPEVKAVANDLAPAMKSFGVYLKAKQLKIID